MMINHLIAELFAWLLAGWRSWCSGISAAWMPQGPAINALDDKLKRDIGVETEERWGVGEVRQAFYRKHCPSKRGQPLL